MPSDSLYPVAKKRFHIFKQRFDNFLVLLGLFFLTFKTDRMIVMKDRCIVISAVPLSHFGIGIQHSHTTCTVVEFLFYLVRIIGGKKRACLVRKKRDREKKKK